MRHDNSVFHALTKHIPWAEFERLVDEHGADWRVRRLTTKSQLVAMLYGQFAGAVSLREIVVGLMSHEARLYHLGVARPSRSTLADANRCRPHEVFSGLLAAMIGQAGRGLRKKVGEAVRLIDSTGLPLSNLSTWARFSAKVCGAKLHIVYDPDADQPVYTAITAANVNDITPAKALPIEAGATYVFDLGYYDYRWWADLHSAGCRIVTRLKKNTRLREVEERPLERGSTVISDRVGYLPARLAASRKNPFTAPIREVCVMTPTGKELRIVTNDLNSSADAIAQIYKRRWQVELFFRWIKQTLKIRHFLGVSENALRIQIAIALIAFLILRMAQSAHQTINSALAFARLVRANLMHRRRLDGLLQHPPPANRDLHQLTLAFHEI